MSEYHLDFEKPVIDLEKQINELIELNSKYDKDLSNEILALKEEKKKISEKIYSNLTRWQRVQLARFPKRPYTLDYINRISNDFFSKRSLQKLGFSWFVTMYIPRKKNGS